MRLLPFLLAVLVCRISIAGGAEEAWGFYAAGRMPDETVLFSADIEPRAAKLLFRPTRVRAVTSADGTRTFEEGVDYRVDLKRGVLTLTDDSRIPCPRLYGGEGEHYGRFRNREGQPMLFGEGDLFHSLQVRIDYEHPGDGWDGKAFVPGNRSASFPQLHRKRKAGEVLRLALIGDSISVGYNASGFVGAKPGRPAFGEQVAEVLRKGGRVEFKNLSRAGATASWGLKQIPEFNAFEPDLVMIAFGMNDGRRPGQSEAYAGTVRAMIRALRERRPSVEIVLVANMLPNEEFSPHAGHLENRDALKQIAGEFERVAVADVMSVTQAMLERKKFADLCGNGVNHPNDFIHRLYASVILRTLGVE